MPSWAIRARDCCLMSFSHRRESMTTPEAHLATPDEAAWQQAFGGALGGALAPREARGAAPGVVDATTSPAAKPSWWRRGLRMARDVAMGFTLIAAIPLTTIHLVGAPAWKIGSVRERVTEINRVRPLSVTADASISPIAAGEALHRLAPPRLPSQASLKPSTPDELPWERQPLEARLFEGRRSNWWAGPDPVKLLKVGKPSFSPDELAWLKQLAEAPLWKDVALVAHAKQIDIYGAMLSAPLTSETDPPLLSIRRIRQISEAGIARAMYFEAIGEPRRAEESLREIVSFGFALVDNGTWILDALGGRIAVDIGRNGLHALGALHADDALTAASAPFTAKYRADTRSLAERQATAVRDLSDPSLPRSFRFEQYGLMNYSVCGSIPRVLTGLSAEESAAVATARAQLPRFASERALLDYMDHRIMLPISETGSASALTSIIEGAAQITSAVTGNPRIASCTRLVTERMSPR